MPGGVKKEQKESGWEKMEDTLHRYTFHLLCLAQKLLQVIN